MATTATTATTVDSHVTASQDENEHEHWSLIPLPYSPIVQTLSDDICGLTSIEMTLIHNVFIRGINSVWRNAPLVEAKPRDRVAFAGYTLALIDGIHSHHHAEESFFFPFVQERLDMNENLEQHKLFHDGMDEFQAYMKQVFSTPDEYNAEKTRALLKAFADPMVDHLRAEIDTVSPEKMRVFEKDQEGIDGLKKMVHDLDEHIKGLPDKLISLPFMITHHDFSQAPNWPPAPAVLIWFFRNIGYWRYSSYWKFSPFTAYGAVNVYK